MGEGVDITLRDYDPVSQEWVVRKPKIGVGGIVSLGSGGEEGWKMCVAPRQGNIFTCKIYIFTYWAKV